MGKNKGEIPVVQVSTEHTPPHDETVEFEKPVSFMCLFSHATPLDWMLMALGTAGAVGNGCVMPLFSLAFGSYTESFEAVNAMAEARAAAIKFVYLSAAAFVAFFCQATCWIRTGSRQATSMRIAFLKSVMRQDPQFFENQTSAGAVLRSLHEDTAAYQQAVSERLGIFIQHTTTFIVGFAVAFWRGWDMTLVLLAALPLLAAVGLALSKLSARMESSSAEAYAQAQDLAQQALVQVRTVAAFGMEQGTVEQYDRALDLPEQVGITQGFLTGLSLGSLNLVLFSAYAGSLYFGATRVAAGAMSGGDVLAVMMAALLGAYSLGQAAPLLQYFFAGRAAAGRLTALDSVQPEIDVNAPGEKLKWLEGELQLQNVSFEYPSTRVPVLTNLSICIPAGKTLALVGSSGSGKSTVVSLLQRFYDPTAGVVLLDGVDIRKLQLRWLRSQMALVSQEPSLFATSIYDNIAMGRPDATQQEVLQAAKAALVDCFVSRLPQGYDTHVGSRGLALSGGQRQRIAIARAILRDAKILLLDEATSALDSASEAAVSLALQNLAGRPLGAQPMAGDDDCCHDSSRGSTGTSTSKTVVMVAHRLSTVRHANTIIVMAGGQVVEHGTHDNLVNLPQGAYAELVQLQSKTGAAAETVPSVSAVTDTGTLDTLHSYLEEQDSYRSAHSAFSAGSSGITSGFSNACSSKIIPGLGRASRLRRRSNASCEGDCKDVETAFFSPRRTQHRANFAATIWETGVNACKRVHTRGACKDRASNPVWKLAPIIKSETAALAIGAVGCLGHGSMMPAFATLLASVLAVFQMNDTTAMLHEATSYALALAFVGVGACCCVAVQFYTFGAVGTKLARRLRVMLLGTMIRQEIGWHDQADHAPSKMTSLLATDTASARGAVADLLGLALQTAGSLALGFGIAYYSNWRVALLVTGLLPLLVSGAAIQTRYMLGSNGKGSGGVEDQAAATTVVTEALAAIHVVQAYNLQKRVCDLFQHMLDATLASERRACYIAGLSLAYSQAVLFIVTAIVVLFGGAEVSSGRSGFEAVLKAFLSIVFAAMGVAQAMVSFPEIGKAGPAVQRMMRLLYPGEHGDSGQVSNANGSADGGKRSDPRHFVVVTDAEDADSQSEHTCGHISNLRGKVELVHVWFSYPTRPDVHVLQDFSLQISPCSTMALVGSSGSGKSTIISLLQRFYEPGSGTVLLDGVDIRCLNLDWLRQQMGLVSQECLLFQGTIEDNIRYGTPSATSQEVRQAAQAAYAHDFIMAMPRGYQTIVGGRGALKLSGGQRQRIAIARAIVRHPKILLLDEATSALDAASEAVVTQALHDLASGSKPKLSSSSSSLRDARDSSGLSSYLDASSVPSSAAVQAGPAGRTTIIVAHRMATVAAADTVAVMSPGGRLLELGSPDELLAIGPQGHYAQLVKQQQLSAVA